MNPRIAGLALTAAPLLKIMKQTCVARALRIRGGRRNDVCERSRAVQEIDEGVH